MDPQRAQTPFDENIWTEKRQKVEILQRKMFQRKMEVARARCVPSSKLCCKPRSLAFHHAEYYDSFDAEVLFAVLAILKNGCAMSVDRKTRTSTLVPNL